MNSEYTLRRLSQDDIPAIVEMHLLGFPNSAMSLLGAPVLRRFYEWLFDAEHRSSIVGVEHKGKLVSFNFGGKYNAVGGGFIIKNMGLIFPRLLFRPWLLFHPEFRKPIKVFRDIVYRRVLRVRPSSADSTVYYNTFGFISQSVHPEYRGKGIARMQMEYQEVAAIKMGFKRLNGTIRLDNEASIKSFEALGYKVEYKEGVKWLEVFKNIGPQ